MIKLTLILLLGVVSINAPAGESAARGTNAPPRFAMEDQFGKLHRVSFPATNLLVLTIADRKGSEQIPGWIDGLRKLQSSQVAVKGIADLSSVPAPLRGMVAKRFRASQPYPVMLDWSGAASRRFGCKPGRANVFVFDRQGATLQRYTGPAGPEQLKSLGKVLEKASDPSGPTH